jgi:hypothetical protein
MGRKGKSGSNPGHRPQSLDHLGPRRAPPPEATRPGQIVQPPAPTSPTAASPPRSRPVGPPMPGEYLLHPTAPLVFGTGRPLDFGLGGETLSFPFPATVAGALRAAARAARGQTPDPFAEPDVLALRWLTLARVQPQTEPLFPRPADAVHVGGRRTRLRPEPLAADVYTDLPPGLEGLALAGDVGNGKPDDAPPWWTAEELTQWLAAPDARPSAACYPGGDRGPLPAPRMHNVIDPMGKGTIDGGLFRSTGLDFSGTQRLRVGSGVLGCWPGRRSPPARQRGTVRAHRVGGDTATANRATRCHHGTRERAALPLCACDACGV